MIGKPAILRGPMMPQRQKTLNFSKEYKNAILSGRKTCTIRLKTKLKAGDKALIIAGGERLGIAKITSVRRKKFSELDMEDVRHEGFRSLKELRRALRKHYGDLDSTTPVSVIRFHLISRESSKSKD